MKSFLLYFIVRYMEECNHFNVVQTSVMELSQFWSASTLGPKNTEPLSVKNLYF